MIDIQDAIRRLMAHDGLRPPHGFLPGSFPGGIDTMFDEATWKAYGWNPIPGLPDYGPDPDASPKPAWAMIAEAGERAAAEDLRQERAQGVDREATRRIRKAYGARSWEHEARRRLRGAATEEQDAERDRLRRLCRALRKRIETMDAGALERFDAADDRHWRPPEAGPAQPPAPEAEEKAE